MPREKYRLDFDDAYQYATSAKLNFQIVSFDSDFDRTDRGKIQPGQVEAPERRDVARCRGNKPPQTLQSFRLGFSRICSPGPESQPGWNLLASQLRPAFS